MEDFKDISNNTLTPLQRKRKIGAGIRNYGFIDKVSDLAAANPNYAQFFKITDLKNCIRNIEDCREIIILLQAFMRMVSNTMIVYSDDAFSMALIYYNALIHGKKDGKIVVENISPKTTAGVRKVVDDTRRSKAAVRETGSMTSEE
jgi:hypothetical protein